MAEEQGRFRTPQRKKLLFALCVLLVLGVLWGHYHLGASLEEVRHQRELEAQKERDLRYAVQTDEQLVQVYKKTLSSLSEQPVKFPQDQVGFLSNVEKELAQVGVEKVSITSTKVDAQGLLTATVNFAGPYYKVLEGVAGWRTMEEIVKMRSLSINFDASGKVSGTTLLETRVQKEVL